MLNFDELWERLNASDESIDIEAKRGSDVGKSAWETISSFSNEPGREGGYLIFGVERTKKNLFENQYDVVGVPDAAKLQDDLATQCRDSFEPAVNPQIRVETRGEQQVVVVFIAEAQPQEKPVFIKSRGIHAGSYRRIAGTDQRCTADDIEDFFAGRRGESYDQGIVADAAVDDLDPRALAEYRRLRKAVNPDAAELREDDEGMLRALQAVKRADGGLGVTVAGLVLFGKQIALRRLRPMARIDYLRVEGTEWVADPARRYFTVEFLEPLVTAIPRIIAQVFEDLPKGFALEGQSPTRTDQAAIPRGVIREAVVNAVMHRSYRTNEPVQIIRYTNRLEIRNPGVSLKPDEHLGEPGSRPRNPQIAAALHDVNLAENKGTGIKAIRSLMKQANLSAPSFRSDRKRDLFQVTLLTHHLLNKEDMVWLASFAEFGLDDTDARALVMLREIGVITNADYRDINGVDTLTASKALQRLCRHELLVKHDKAANTFYLPGERVQLTLQVAHNRANSPSNEANSLTNDPNSLTNAANSLTKRAQDSETDRQAKTARLNALVAAIGKRAKPEMLQQVILLACEIEPRSVRELARMLSRSIVWILKQLTPLVNDGLLAYEFPDDRNHPKQRYRAVHRGSGAK